MTRNSFVSQGVMLVGLALLLLGFTLDQSKVVFAIGYTMVWFGMIQSFYGTVLECEGVARLVFAIVGVPLSLGLVYVAYLSLWDYLASWVSILMAVLLVLALQAVTSWVALQVWKWRSLAA